jgi:hypothetical protein
MSCIETPFLISFTTFQTIHIRVLQPFLVGFTTKDLSLNFLSGKAALRDVEVNVDAINEKINENPGVKQCNLTTHPSFLLYCLFG